MATVDDHLRRWSEAGIVDAATSERIREFERQEHRGKPGAPRSPREDLPGVTEAVLYLGVAVIVAGAMVLTAENWGDLQPWARIAVLAVPAVLVFLAGFALRSVGEPQYGRASDLAWAATVALAAGTAAVICAEADVEDSLAVLIVGVTATVVASGLWAANPGTLQLLALGASLFMLATGLGGAVDDSGPTWVGMSLFGIGVIALVMVEAGLLLPKPVARAIFGIFAIFGPFMTGLEDSVMWAELMVFAVGGTLIGLAVKRNTFVYMVIAVGGMFIGLITFVFEHLSDTIGVALSLLLCGAAIVGGVLLLGVMRPSMRGRAK